MESGNTRCLSLNLEHSYSISDISIFEYSLSVKKLYYSVIHIFFFLHCFRIFEKMKVDCEELLQRVQGL